MNIQVENSRACNTNSDCGVTNFKLNLNPVTDTVTFVVGFGYSVNKENIQKINSKIDEITNAACSGIKGNPDLKFPVGICENKKCTARVIDPKNKIILAQLVHIDGGNLTKSGYYEGSLNLEDVANDDQYNIYLCSKNWNVEVNSCYKFKPIDVEENKEVNMQTEGLSGCYTGELEAVNCE